MEKRDRRSLPFGLIRYRPGMFAKLHGLGSGMLTASQVAALFGKSRFAGRYALAAHMSGRAALPGADSDLTLWAREFEAPILRRVAVEKGWQVEHIHAYARHPRLPRLLASPDAVHWRLDRDHPGCGEAKVVADRVFEEDWQDGPPLEFELQHQTQLACTGASHGFIAVLVLGSWRRELLVYETEPHAEAQRLITDAATALFAILLAGEMPPPDEHPVSMDALQRVFPQAEPGKVVSLGDPEAVRRFQDWEQAKLDRSAAEGREEAARNWFFRLDPTAAEFRIGNDRTVRCKTIYRKESVRTVRAGSYRRWSLDRTDDGGSNHDEEET